MKTANEIAHAISEGVKIAVTIDPRVRLVARSDDEWGEVFASWMSLRFDWRLWADAPPSTVAKLIELGWRLDGGSGLRFTIIEG